MTPQEQDQAWGDILWALQYQRRWQLTDLSALVCNWRDRRCMCMLDQNVNDMYPLLSNAGPAVVVHRNWLFSTPLMQVLWLSYTALVHSAR